MIQSSPNTDAEQPTTIMWVAPRAVETAAANSFGVNVDTRPRFNAEFHEHFGLTLRGFSVIWNDINDKISELTEHRHVVWLFVALNFLRVCPTVGQLAATVRKCVWRFSNLSAQVKLVHALSKINLVHNGGPHPNLPQQHLAVHHSRLRHQFDTLEMCTMNAPSLGPRPALPAADSELSSKVSNIIPSNGNNEYTVGEQVA